METAIPTTRSSPPARAPRERLPRRINPSVRALALAAALALAVLAQGCGPGAPARSLPIEDIRIETSDGAVIAATLYNVVMDSARPPGVVLIPELGRTRAGWETFARRAQRAGFAVLALDLRGHGDSTGPGGRDMGYEAFEHEDWLGAFADIRATLAALVEHGAHPDNLAVMGAALGGHIALDYALDDWAVQGVVIVSPGLEYRGFSAEESVQQFARRPLLLMTTSGDAYSSTAATQLESIAPGHCEVREYRGAAHGTDIFAASRSAGEQALLWLDQVIGTDTVILDTHAPPLNAAEPAPE